VNTYSGDVTAPHLNLTSMKASPQAVSLRLERIEQALPMLRRYL
jgi:hypothetical protein